MVCNRTISFEMSLDSTEAVTGYFTCVPTERMTLKDILDLLSERPMDTFLHGHALNRICSLPLAEYVSLLESRSDWSFPAQSVFLESSLLNPELKDLSTFFDFDAAVINSPLINLRSACLPNREIDLKLIPILRDNIVYHKPLKKLAGNDILMLRSSIDLAFQQCPSGSLHIGTIHSDSFHIEHDYPKRIISAAGAAKLASDKLEKAGVFFESEMRHVSSLSPIALLRKWKLQRSIDSGRNKFLLSGIHTAYGKGLYTDDARASCVMEILERYCSYASVESCLITECKNEHPLVYSRFSEISSKALDPSCIKLEIPYNDEPLWWTLGEQVCADGLHEIFVPVQMVYMFSNLDEIDLFSGLGSTGLAAHTDMAMAKTAALLECIERDCDAISIFDRSRCFKISTNDQELSPLFSAYANRGIQIQFQDISNEMGIPCYRCFVVDSSGRILKGTGAGLNAKKAFLSALMETPYPFPYGPPSGRCFDNLQTFILEDLPDYTTENPYQDLYIIEQTLVSNGYAPVYVDITRKDTEFPVVKAIIPGFEIMNDFDDYSRISPRMAANYLRTVSG